MTMTDREIEHALQDAIIQLNALIRAVQDLQQEMASRIVAQPNSE